MIHWLAKNTVKLVLLFLGCFPPPLNRWIAYVLAVFLYGVYRVTPYRNFIYNNLKTAFGCEKTRRELHRIAFQNVWHLSLSLMEILRFPYLNDEKLCRLVRVEGEENLRLVSQEGRGLISISAHFGNWELMGPRAAVLGLPSHVLTVRQAGLAEELLNEYRLAKGVVPISRWNNLRYVLRLLRENKTIGVLNDQHGEYNNLILEFFGQKVSVPAGPANFAILGKTALVPTFIVRQKDYSHVLYFEPPLYPDPELDKKANVVMLNKKYLAILEKYLRAFPEQGFWVYNRFDKLPQSQAS